MHVLSPPFVESVGASLPSGCSSLATYFVYLDVSITWQAKQKWPCWLVDGIRYTSSMIFRNVALCIVAVASGEYALSRVLK